MKTYKVTYKETLVHEFYVEADNREEAEKLFWRGLNEDAFDLSGGFVQDEECCDIEEGDDEYHYHYTPSAENGDYSPSNPWDAPGMKMSDFI